MILCAILIVPLLVVDVPPLGDYPNHLARAFVLASLPGDTVLAKMYAPHWSVIPNLALDLITPPLIHVLPVHVAGRIVIAAAVLLPVLGTVACNTALGGRWWSLGVGLAAYNSCLLYGFLNFILSLGLALLLAASWLRWRETRPVAAVAVATAGAPLLFACHLMGLLFYAALIGATELTRLRGFRPRPALARAAVLALVFAVPVALYAASDLEQLGGDAIFLPPGKKLLQLVTTFSSYNWWLDMATAAVATGLPALCLATRRGTFPPPAALAMLLIFMAYLAAPYGWKGTYLLDTRLAVMLGFMLFAGFVPRNWTDRFRATAVAALLLAFACHQGLLTTVWYDHNSVIADLRQALAPVQPGQAVYVADAGLKEAPAYWAADPDSLLLSDGVAINGHLGALALIERRAYWPFEFDMPSQQPIVTLPPYEALAAKVGWLPTRREAIAAELCGFDYVLMTEAEAVPPLPASRFRLLVGTRFAALYAIKQCHPP
jgi:hypothetical protein